MDCDTQEIGCNSFITKPKREFPLLSKCLMLYWCWCCSHWNFIVDCIQNDQIKLGIKDVFTVSKTTHPCFFQVVFYCEVFSILRLSFDWRLIMIFDVVFISVLPSSAQSQAPARLSIALISSNIPTAHHPPTRTSSKKLEYQPSDAWAPRSPPCWI